MKVYPYENDWVTSDDDLASVVGRLALVDWAFINFIKNKTDCLDENIVSFMDINLRKRRECLEGLSEMLVDWDIRLDLRNSNNFIMLNRTMMVASPDRQGIVDVLLTFYYWYVNKAPPSRNGGKHWHKGQLGTENFPHLHLRAGTDAILPSGTLYDINGKAGRCIFRTRSVQGQPDYILTNDNRYVFGAWWDGY